MVDGWKEVKVTDVCRIRRGASPRPIHEYIRDRGIPWVKISDATSIQSRHINSTKEYIKVEGKSKSRFIERGTLILSNSATPGIPKFMGIDACVHDGWLIIDEFNKVDSEYLYYTFINERLSLLNLSNGSVFRNLKTDIVKNYPITLPPLNEQKAIAHILSTLDEKIETNNKINKTLEKMAQEIFKHWFGDFEFPNKDGEPYKSSGGEMVESELGLIPKGWEVKKVEEMCEVSSSKRIFAKEYSKQGIPFYRGKEIIEKSKGKSVSTELFITNEKYLEIQEKYPIPKEGDMLLTSVGTLGVPYLVVDEEFYFKDGNLTWFRAYLKKGYREYIFLWINSKEGKEVIDSITIGSTQKALTISVLKNIKLVISEEYTLEEFHKIIKTLIDKIQSNDKENAKLIELRDTLLPKLMSGQIRVPLNIDQQ